MDDEKDEFCRKYTAKMFRLKKFLVSECDFNWFVFVRVVRNQRYVSGKSIR